MTEPSLPAVPAEPALLRFRGASGLAGPACLTTAASRSARAAASGVMTGGAGCSSGDSAGTTRATDHLIGARVPSGARLLVAAREWPRERDQTDHSEDPDPARPMNHPPRLYPDRGVPISFGYLGEKQVVHVLNSGMGLGW